MNKSRHTTRHDSLIDDVLSGLETKSASQAPAPQRHENRFLRRSSALSDRAAGTLVEKTLHWVDPARCRMWGRHNRRYDLLDHKSCSDLIEGIRVQGGQEFPAIVRALKDDPDHDYEVICGARRHWTISWLRAHNYPQFLFLIEIRDLTDEEAFRLADIENRDRRDISDYERAIDYAHACDFYYDGHQGRMAERLEVSDAWLSRYLDMARLPAEIASAYENISDLREYHARKLKPLLGDAAERTRLIERARGLAQLQARCKAKHTPGISAQHVLERLLAGYGRKVVAKPRVHEYRGEQGGVVLHAETGARGLSVKLVPGASRENLAYAFEQLLDDHTRDGVLPIGKK
mgnify:CR=1 FL=1